MTLKGTSSLQRTTYFYLCFHDSTLIFQKQQISLGSGINGFVEVLNNCRISIPPNPIDKKSRSRENEAAPADDLGFFDRLDFVAQFLDRFADVVP